MIKFSGSQSFLYAFYYDDYSNRCVISNFVYLGPSSESNRGPRGDCVFSDLNSHLVTYDSVAVDPKPEISSVYQPDGRNERRVTNRRGWGASLWRSSLAVSELPYS